MKMLCIVDNIEYCMDEKQQNVFTERMRKKEFEVSINQLEEGSSDIRGKTEIFSTHVELNWFLAQVERNKKKQETNKWDAFSVKIYILHF